MRKQFHDKNVVARLSDGNIFRLIAKHGIVQGTKLAVQNMTSKIEVNESGKPVVKKRSLAELADEQPFGVPVSELTKKYRNAKEA